MESILTGFTARWWAWAPLRPDGVGNMGWSCLTSPGAVSGALLFQLLGPSCRQGGMSALSAALSTHLVKNFQQPASTHSKASSAVSLFTTVPVRLYAPSPSPLQGTFCHGNHRAGKSIELGNEILTDLRRWPDGHRGPGQITVNNPIMFFFLPAIPAAYAVIKVSFFNLKRGGILLIQIAVGSLYMFNLEATQTASPSGASRSSACASPFSSSHHPAAGSAMFSDKALPNFGLTVAAGEVPRIAGPSAWTHHHQSQYHERRSHRPGCRQ